MDDKDLSALIRMAAEAERMEQDSGRSFQWARARASRRDELMRRLTGLGGLAAAACLAMMVVVWLKAPQGSTAPAKTVTASAGVEVEKPGPVEQGSVLLAVFHDSNNGGSYVQLRQHPWGKDAKVSELGGGELLRTAMAGTCHDNPERVVAIAVSGPKDLLPRSTSEAEVLAACVADNGRCGDDSLCYANSAAAYLPPGLTVVAETLGPSQH